MAVLSAHGILAVLDLRNWQLTMKMIKYVSIRINEIHIIRMNKIRNQNEVDKRRQIREALQDLRAVTSQN